MFLLVSVKLPCQNIFALRSSRKAALYSSELCATWWTLAYYRMHHQILADGDSCYEDSHFNVSSSHVNTNPVFSQNEKYRRTFFVTQKLSIIVYEPLMREFNEKLAVLKNLLAMWQQTNEVVLVKKILILQVHTLFNIATSITLCKIVWSCVKCIAEIDLSRDTAEFQWMFEVQQ